MKRFCVLIVFMCIFVGCSFTPKKFSAQRPEVYESIGFYGFILPPLKGEGVHLIREPLGGTFHYAEAVSSEIKTELEEMVWNELNRAGIRGLLMVEQLQAALGAELDRQKSMDIKELVLDSAKESALDAAIVGFIYRYREREGSDYAVSSPALVSFDLFLLDVRKGEVKSKYLVDIEQKSLSENLLGIIELKKTGLRWVKANVLAREGVKKAIEHLLGVKVQ